MRQILVLHGPNLNLLGAREPTVYGFTSLSELNERLQNQAKKNNIQLLCKQSNGERELIDFIHQAHDNQIDFIIFNPAAYTHSSIALRDALQAVNIPFIEIHISNIYAREPFRRLSYFSDIAQGVVSGFGIKGYFLALQHIIDDIK